MTSADPVGSSGIPCQPCWRVAKKPVEHQRRAMIDRSRLQPSQTTGRGMPGESRVTGYIRPHNGFAGLARGVEARMSKLEGEAVGGM